MQPSYRRAFSTLGCPELSLAEVLAMAARHHIDAVELRTLEGTTELPTLFTRSGTEPVRQVHQWQGTVEVLVLSTSFKLVRPSEAERAALIAFVPWAEALGVPWLRAFDGGELSDDGTVPLATETMRWWRQQRSKHGWKVDLMVETHDGLVSPEAIGRFCSGVSDVALLWDAHNTWRKTGVDPLALWPRIAEHVVHIHVKDSVSRPSDGQPYTFVLPGEGEFPMQPLVAALRRDRYSHALSLEWERQWHPSLPSLELALQTAVNRSWW